MLTSYIKLWQQLWALSNCFPYRAAIVAPRPVHFQQQSSLTQLLFPRAKTLARLSRLGRRSGLAVVGALLGAFVLALLWPTLPSLEALTDYQPKIPLRVVSAEGELLGEFGEERRAVITIREVPDVMKQAILAAEDERFYQHGGVDYLSVARAALANLASGTQQGAGTITMQVARNFFLTREKTVTRKLREVLLAWKIEANLTKDEILELYVNQIFLGQRAYGFAAASQIYFGRPLKDVTDRRRRRCWPACPRRRPPTTRSPTRSGPRRASSTCFAGCTNCGSSRMPSSRKHKARH